jgi:hypothetical protein
VKELLLDFLQTMVWDGSQGIVEQARHQFIYPESLAQETSAVSFLFQ